MRGGTINSAGVTSIQTNVSRQTVIIHLASLAALRFLLIRNKILRWELWETDCSSLLTLSPWSRTPGRLASPQPWRPARCIMKNWSVIKYSINSYCDKNTLLILTLHFSLSIYLLRPCRRVTSTRRPSRPSYIPSPAPPHTILRCGQPPRPLTATSARDCCGVLHARACAVPSVESSATRSAKIYSTLIVCKVREMLENIKPTSDPYALISDWIKNIMI